jgi:hypothetical protein
MWYKKKQYQNLLNYILNSKNDFISIKNILIYIFKYIIKKILIQYFRRKWKDKILKWKFSVNLDNMISAGVPSAKIYNLKLDDWIFERYLAKKAEIFEEENKMYVGDVKIWTWSAFYNFYMNFKEGFIDSCFYILYDFEDIYLYLSNSVGTQRWTPQKRLKYTFLIKKNKQKRRKYLNYIQYINKEKSRDAFFFKRWKLRKRRIFIYFFKGIINWITYLLFKKFIFKSVKNLKSQKIKFKYRYLKKYKYNLKDISDLINITGNLEKVPPQLWALSILYDYYYFGIIFYILDTRNIVMYKYKEAPEGLNVKWKIYGSDSLFTISSASYISYREFLTSKFNIFKVLTKRPINLASIFYMFALEKLSYEGPSRTRRKAWGDVSSLYGVTYDSLSTKLKFEGKIEENLKYEEKIKKLEENNVLLSTKFSEIERLKNAYQFKISFDSMHNDNAMHSLIPKMDPDEEQKRALFEDVDLTYKSTLGMHLRGKKYKNIRFKIFWDYERHMVLLSSVYTPILEIIEEKEPDEYQFIFFKKKKERILHEGYYLKECTEIKELLNNIGVIYYDITLKEIKLFVDNSINVKKKVIKAINITVEPSIIVNINYENYNDFLYDIPGMDIERSLATLLDANKISLKKNIKSKRIHNIDDMLDVNYISSFFLGKSEIIIYEGLKLLEDLELMHVNNLPKLYVTTILSMDLIEAWNDIISGRTKVKDYKEVEVWKKNAIHYRWIIKGKSKHDTAAIKKSQNAENAIIYLNIVKWNLKQWLHLDLTEREKLKFRKKNTILLNEKYNVWNLKLIPIRVKLPIVLKTYWARKHISKNVRFIDKSDRIDLFMVLGHVVGTIYDKPWLIMVPPLKAYIRVHRFRTELSRQYGKKSNEMLITWVIGDKNDKKAHNLNVKYKKEIRHLANLYWAQSLVNLKVLLQICWDRMLYDKVTMWAEEFDGTAWANMRIRTYQKKDALTRKKWDNLNYLLYEMFSPKAYTYWFTRAILNPKLIKYILLINNIIWIYIIYYCPGEFLYNIWLILIPGWINIYFIWIWYFSKDHVKETLKGKDFYLYKFQASQRKPPLPRGLPWYFYNKEKQDRLEKEYGIKGTEKTWQTNRYSYIKNKHNTILSDYTLKRVIPVFFILFFYKFEMWRLSKYRGYDFYKKYDEEFSNNGYRDKVWVWENWERLLSGGNVYNIWYINYFRENKGLSPRLLDIQDDPWRKNAIIQMRGRYIDKHGVKQEIVYNLNKSDTGFIGKSFIYENHVSNVLKHRRFFLENTEKFEVRNVNWSHDKTRFYYINKVRVRTKVMQKESDDAAAAELRDLFKSADFGDFRKRAWSLFRYVVRTLLSERYRKRKEKRQERQTLEHVKKVLKADEKTLKESYKQFIFNSRTDTMDFIKESQNKSNKIISLKKESFKTGKPLDIEIMLSISNHELHKNIFFYNLLKYKFYRNLGRFEKEDIIKSLIASNNINPLKGIISWENPINWEKHLLIMHKLNKYIINISLKDKKKEILLLLWKKKISTFFDLYENLIKLYKLIIYWSSDYDFAIFLKNIIQLFFK